MFTLLLLLFKVNLQKQLIKIKPKIKYSFGIVMAQNNQINKYMIFNNISKEFSFWKFKK